MDLYNKLKADKSITEDDFVELIQQLFEYTDDDGNNDDSLTYNIAANIIRETDYDKVLKLASSYPVIFKTFLLQPELYAEFLDTILTPAVQYIDSTFFCREEENNITVLICCATFHLSKLFTMIGHKISTIPQNTLNKSAATYYHMPLANWLSKLISELPDEFTHGSLSENMLDEHHYMLLMQSVSKELKFNDWPIVKFFSAIKKKWPSRQQERFDQYHIRLSYMVKVLIEYDDIPSDEPDSDIYDKHIRDIYRTEDDEDDDDREEKGLIKWQDFIDPNDHTKSVFSNELYTLKDFLDPSEVNKKDTSILRTLNRCLDSDTMPFLLMIVYAVGPQIVYDMTHNNTIKRNNIWNETLKAIGDKFSGYSDNLERDAEFIFTMLFSKNMVTYDNLYGQTFVMNMIGNVWNNDSPHNIRFIRKLLKAMLTRDYSPLKTKAFDFLKGHETKELLVGGNNTNHKSVLTKLLEYLSLPTVSNLSKDISTLNTRRSVFQDNNQSIMVNQSPMTKSSKTPDYDLDKKKLYFKPIIKGLLNLEVIQGEASLLYLSELYKYKQSLQDVLDINLDDYKFAKIDNIPRSLSSRSIRSVDKSPLISPVSLPNKEQSIFKKKVPIIYKKKDFKIITVATAHNKTEQKIKIGNAIYELTDVTFIDENTIQLNHNKASLQDLPFANKKLLKQLLKHYTRTVEGMDKKEYGGANRIIKIRTYLQNRYPKISDELIVHTEHEKELDTLVEIWNSKGINSLNTSFYIKYFTYINDNENGTQTREFDDGIDEGGLTKNFLTKCAKQLKTKFFKQAYDGSDRYILNGDGLKNVEFIASLLATLVLREIYLDFHLSIVYMAFLMFRRVDISDEEIFLYFLLDIDADTRYNSYLKYCENNYTYTSEDDENYYFAMACNPKSQVEDSLNYIYNLENANFQKFSNSFLFEKKIFYRKFQNINSKIRIFDMDKLLSISKISKKDLKQRIFNKIQLANYDNNTLIVYQYLQDLMINDKKEEYTKMYNDYANSNESYFKSDADKMNLFAELKSSQYFKRKVLMFWTGSQGILSENYKVYIDSDIDGRMPVSHTCFNQIDLPTDDYIKSKQELFNSFMDIFMSGMDENFTSA
jgi:hypothetical protein